MLCFNTRSSRFSLHGSHSRPRIGDCIRYHTLHTRCTLRYACVISSSPSQIEQGTNVLLEGGTQLFATELGEGDWEQLLCYELKVTNINCNLSSETSLRSCNSLTDSRIQLSQQNLPMQPLSRWEKIHGTFYSLVHP